MEIGISCNAFGRSGGMERFAMDLVRGLADVGLRPHVFSPRFDMTLPEIGLIERHRIGIGFVPRPWRGDWFSRRLRRERQAAGIDVLIGCNRTDAADIVICGGTHRGFLRAIGRRPGYNDRRQIALEIRQYDRANVIVAHSRLMRGELRQLYGVPESKIEVLYPPIDGARFSPATHERRAELRREYGFGDDEVVLLFPSGSHERKGLPLIESVLRDTDLPIVVAVAGRPPSSLSERVRYLGYVREIEDCYRAADYTILASTYEPFGLVGVESVMCGTPVVMSSNIGCCEVIAESAKLEFAPGDAASLRAALERAVQARGAARPAAGAVNYDTNLAAHVAALLALAADLAPGRQALAARGPGLL